MVGKLPSLQATLLTSEGVFRARDSFKNLRMWTKEAAAAINNAGPVEAESCHAYTSFCVIEGLNFNVGARERTTLQAGAAAVFEAKGYFDAELRAV